MILVKKMKIFHVLFLSKRDGENIFAKVLYNKKALKDYKNIFLLKTQTQYWHFLNGHTP